jgi:hypothetical protein
MRKKSFIIAIVSLFILILFLYFQKPIQITSKDIPEKFQQNQKLFIQGRVIKQTSSVIYLNNNISLSCTNCPNYLNKNITATAILETWTGKPVIKVLKIQEAY